MKVTVEISKQDYERLKELCMYRKELSGPEYAGGYLIKHHVRQYLDFFKSRYKPIKEKPTITRFSAKEEAQE